MNQEELRRFNEEVVALLSSVGDMVDDMVMEMGGFIDEIENLEGVIDDLEMESSKLQDEVDNLLYEMDNQ